MSNYHPTQEPNSMTPPPFIYSLTYNQCSEVFVQYDLDQCTDNNKQQQCFIKTFTTQTLQSWQLFSCFYPHTGFQEDAWCSTSSHPRSLSSPRTSLSTQAGPVKSPLKKSRPSNESTTTSLTPVCKNDHEARTYKFFKHWNVNDFLNVINMHVYCLISNVILIYPNLTMKVINYNSTSKPKDGCNTHHHNTKTNSNCTTAAGNVSNIPKTTTTPSHSHTHTKSNQHTNNQSDEATPRHLDQPHNSTETTKSTTYLTIHVIQYPTCPFFVTYHE